MGAGKLTDNVSVAVVGLSCRFPGDGDSLEGFWDFICAGKSAWSKIPKERFNIDAFRSSSKDLNTISTPGAHFLKQDITKFDANFFNLPKVEVDAIDPQQRIMVEVAYEALERAGIPADSLAGTKTGVFMGHFTSDYKEMIARDPTSAPMYTASGSFTTSTSGRISWLWDLRGPCFTLDTACSSSLVALHQACLSLRTGESDVAIVGGTNLMLNPEVFMFMANQEFLAPDGKSKAFDASANGYGRGEGFGCVILKRVDDALQANDPIRAVIRGTGSNHDGHTLGFTLPSSRAQAALIRQVYQDAGLSFQDTGYIEAHGTGTQAGDFEETTALAETIAATRSANSKLVVGSVKTNIGHLEAAAGIAGVIKSILILERGTIPPNIHFNNPNPKIKFDEWKLHIPTKIIEFPSHNGIRRISVNSFGYAGTNAHAILDDRDSYLRDRGLVESDAVVRHRKMSSLSRTNTFFHSWTPQLFAISAQDKHGVARAKDQLLHYITERTADLELKIDHSRRLMAKLAFTLGSRRSHLQWREHVVASSLEELVQNLTSNESSAPVMRSSKPPRLGFVFTGQGAQWPRMGVELMSYPVFEEAVHSADVYLREICLCPWSAVEELEKSKSTSLLHLAEFSQTLCAVLQVALVDLLRSWGIRPTAVAGHSSGEIGAAYALGALSREDAWRTAYFRGMLSAGMKVIAPEIDGSMMAVGLSPDKAEEWISKTTKGYLVVACINSPTSVTVSGDTAGIDQLLEMLKEASIFARKLLVDTAYHSPHMHNIAQEYYERLADLNPLQSTSGCKMHSSVTGCSIDASQLGVVNWVRNLTSPVRFSDAIYDMVRPTNDGTHTDDNAIDLLIEIGPHSALQGPVMQTLSAHKIAPIPYHSAVVRNQNAVETALNLVGILWSRGYNVDIKAVNAVGTTSGLEPLVDLPAYPWKHSQRYYHNIRTEKGYLFRSNAKTSLIGAPIPSNNQREHTWRHVIRLSEESWVGDHQIQGSILYPAAGYMAMALEAASQIADVGKHVVAYKLRDVQFMAAAIISPEQPLECIIQLRPHITATRDPSSTWTEFTVASCSDGTTLITNCSGLLLIEYEDVIGSEFSREKAFELHALKGRYAEAQDVCQSEIDCDELYKTLKSIGLQYGPAFANVCQARNDYSGHSFGQIQIPDVLTKSAGDQDRPHVVHPGTLDAIFHLVFATIMGKGVLNAMVPKFISEVSISATMPWQVGTKLPGFSCSERHGLRDLIADVVMFSHDQGPDAINIQGLTLTEVGGGSALSENQDGIKSIGSRLVWKPAVELLTPTELGRALTAPNGGGKLVEYLQLLHHATPGLSVLEVNKSETPYIFSHELLAMFDTGKVTVACEGAEQKAASFKDEFNASVEAVEHSTARSDQSLRDRHFDVIVVSDRPLLGEQSDCMFLNVMKVLKPGSKLCILADDEILAWFQSKWEPRFGQSMVFRGTDHNLVIATRASPSMNNDEESRGGSEAVKIIVPTDMTREEASFAEEMTTILTEHGYLGDHFTWSSDVSLLAGSHCISLLEMSKPLLQNLSEDDFGSIRDLILNTASLLWITGFGGPSSRIIDGLARVVRNETPGLKLQTLHADDQLPALSSRLAEQIVLTFSSKLDDDEFLVKDGIVQIGRVEEDHEVNRDINTLLPGAVKTISKMPLKSRPFDLKLNIRMPGMLDTLCLEFDERVGTELHPEDVEIDTKVSSINFRDLMTSMGQIPDRFIGIEAAGIIRRTGSAVTKFHVGDKVAILGHGAHSTCARTRVSNCAVIPEGMTFEQAATVPTVHGTAWYALVHLARIRQEQTILIHAAAGGVGQAAIQVAKHFGLEIFATVSTPAKRQLLRDAYGIPNDHIFNSRDLSFVKGIKRMTKGRGVDVVLNSLSGEALRQTWHCIAPFGYFVEIGLRDILSNTGLDMAPFKQDATFTFLNLDHVQRKRPDIMTKILEGAFNFFRKGISTPIVPISSYPISEVEQAFRLMQAGKHVGKLVLTWGEEDVVPVLEGQRKPLKLDPEAVYVLVGGLGGLGRSLSMRLAHLGARKLCFFSRSGAKSAAAKELVRDLEAEDVEVLALKCDITAESAVAAAITQCARELGPIRGVFQCAMVLQDSLLSKMTHRQWLEATQPKIQGSWNLHKYLPEVDFFITLSSCVATFGNRGQGNYSAGGSYEDALAYYRRSLGLRATTVDLGIMREIGVLAETGMTDNLKDWDKPYGIGEAEFHALMEVAMEGDMNGTGPAQIITGLATGGSAVLAGIDPPYYLDNALFSRMALTGLRDAQGDSAGNDASGPVHARLGQVESLDDAANIVTEALVKQIARMLQMPADEIDTTRFLHNYGIDSLLAIEVVNWALKEAKSTVNVIDVLSSIPITALSRKVAARSVMLPKELAQE